MTPEYNPFPSHDVNPKEKAQKPWMLEVAKAIPYDAMASYHQMFFRNGGTYEKNRLYRMGKQPIGVYKKRMEVEDTDTSSWMNIDWTPRGPAVKLLDIAVSKVLQIKYSPTATPIDPESRSTNNSLYARMKAKMVMRELMAKADPDMLNVPTLSLEAGDPQDMEELEMRMNFGEQFNRAKDAEQVIQLAFFNNHVDDKLRKEMGEDALSTGVAIYKDFLDEKGMPASRAVAPEKFVTNFCRDSQFNDMRYAAELIYVPTPSLGKFFTGEELKELEELPQRQNPFAGEGVALGDMMNNNRGMTLVLDYEYISYDTLAWEEGVSKYNNPQFSRSDISYAAKKPEKHIVKRVKTIYTGKWVVGTDLIYEFGPAKNQKRSTQPKYMADTCLSYKVQAYSCRNMICANYVERIIPMIDDYMMCNLRGQNIRNNMIPNGWAIDLDALESVALKMGGIDFGPEQVLDFFRKKGIMMFRGQGLKSTNPNAKPIDIMVNQVAGELMGIANEKLAIVLEMKEVLGLNDITDGSTPSDRMLNGVAAMSMEATNNALYPLMENDRLILGRLSNDMMMRSQQAIRMGGISGFLPAINENTMLFVKADSAIGMRAYAISIEMRMNDEQKAWLLQSMAENIKAGYLDESDVIMIMNTYNLKQAQQMIAYKVKKGKEKRQQEAMALQQANGEVQVRSAQAAEQAKQQTLQLEYSLKMQFDNNQTNNKMKIEMMKMEHQTMLAAGADQTKTEGKVIEAKGKENVARINNGQAEDEGLMMEEDEV